MSIKLIKKIAMADDTMHVNIRIPMAMRDTLTQDDKKFGLILNVHNELSPKPVVFVFSKTKINRAMTGAIYSPEGDIIEMKTVEYAEILKYNDKVEPVYIVADHMNRNGFPKMFSFCISWHDEEEEVGCDWFIDYGETEYPRKNTYDVSFYFTDREEDYHANKINED